MELQPNLLISISIAKIIIDNYPGTITSVQKDREYLDGENYSMTDTVKLHFSVRPLLNLVKSVLREATGLDTVDIKIYQVDEDESFKEAGDSRVAGMVIKKSESKFVILLDKRQTYCTQRFTLCKELMQIYVDCITKSPDKLDPNYQIAEATRDLFQRFYSSTHIPQLNDKFHSTEVFAHSIALELMIPYTLRDEIKKDIDSGASMFSIAKRLFITEETLTEYLNSYFSFTTPVYKKIGKIDK